MRATFQADALSNALSLVSGAISSRAVVDTLRSACLTVAGDGCIVAGTDMEISVCVPIEATETEPGVCLAPLQLKEIADLSEGEVRVECRKAAGLAVTTSTGTYQLPTADVADWPNLGEPEGAPVLTLVGEKLAAALSRVTFAAAKDEGKYATRAVYWDVTPNLKLVATDGKRLAVMEMAAHGYGVMSATALVPPKAMQLLPKLCQPGNVEVWLPKGAKGLAHFHTDAGQLSTRLVEGQFPPYRDVIPKKAKATASFKAGAFLQAVRQAAILTDEESKRVSFAFGIDSLLLTAQGATTGKADVQVPILYDGQPMTVHLDPAYIIDMLRILPAEEPVTLELNGPEKSVVFRAGKDYLYLVVPLCT